MKNSRNTQKDLLLAFYQHLIDNDTFPINSFSKERAVDRFLKRLERESLMSKDKDLSKPQVKNCDLPQWPTEEEVKRFRVECEQEAFDTGNSDQFRIGLDLGIQAALKWVGGKMTNLSTIDQNVLAQVEELLQSLKENDKDAPPHHHIVQIMNIMPTYSTTKPAYDLTLNIDKSFLVTVIARAILVMESMNKQEDS